MPRNQVRIVTQSVAPMVFMAVTDGEYRDPVEVIEEHPDTSYDEFQTEVETTVDRIHSDRPEDIYIDGEYGKRFEAYIAQAAEDIGAKVHHVDLDEFDAGMLYDGSSGDHDPKEHGYSHSQIRQARRKMREKYEKLKDGGRWAPLDYISKVVDEERSVIGEYLFGTDEDRLKEKTTTQKIQDKMSQYKGAIEDYFGPHGHGKMVITSTNHDDELRRALDEHGVSYNVFDALDD